MKKILWVLVILALAGSWAVGWQSSTVTSSGSFSSTSGPVRIIKNNYLQGDTSITLRDASGTLLFWADTSQPRILFSGNVYSGSGYGLYTDYIYDRASGGAWWKILASGTAGTTSLVLSDSARKLYFIPGSVAGDTTKGGICFDSTGGTWRIRPTAGKPLMIQADSIKLGNFELLTFGRTAIADTSTAMLGDTTKMGLIITPFATRGAPTGMITMSGLTAGGLIIFQRPAADTAKYDSYSIFRLRQP